jgi:hypothetical protein
MKGYQYVHIDGLQLFLVGVCGVDMIFFTCFLFAYELDKQNTISDSLFDRPDYLIVLSIALSLRLLGVAFFHLRYRNSSTAWVIAGFCGLFLTLFGW